MIPIGAAAPPSSTKCAAGGSLQAHLDARGSRQRRGTGLSDHTCGAGNSQRPASVAMRAQPKHFGSHREVALVFHNAAESPIWQCPFVNAGALHSHSCAAANAFREEIAPCIRCFEIPWGLPQREAWIRRETKESTLDL